MLSLLAFFANLSFLTLLGSLVSSLCSSVLSAMTHLLFVCLCNRFELLVVTATGEKYPLRCQASEEHNDWIREITAAIAIEDRKFSSVVAYYNYAYEASSLLQDAITGNELRVADQVIRIGTMVGITPSDIV